MQRKRGKNSDLCIYELLGEREKTITKEKFEFYKTIGSTMLSKNELRRMLAELGKEVSEEELLEMIYSADANGHGYVSYDSFLHIVEQFKLWQEETVSSQIGLTYD